MIETKVLGFSFLGDLDFETIAIVKSSLITPSYTMQLADS